ncbi:DUF4974 domain-containing protein [Chitinophaga sp. SYP-B3965]|uniref:FecR family protein n=1 Tax=Chitinophaga sp. SYP-B3965 TaxID=2663120 RepID=UPI0012998779|nr:FecR domain-containing protein [Chitinophaga sp. SYP-B3965]MRG43516.1 DUF4974 domain-containing protein [Chitinophaga sp. SYP-B3965]
MDSNELRSLIAKFHQKTITDLELARLKMFVGQQDAQEKLEDIDFPELPPAELPAHLYAGIRRRISRPVKQIWLAAAASVLLAGLVAGWLWHTPSVKPVVWAKVSAASGERKKVILPDSSVVYLNAGSTLSYPDTARLVHLKGEAFFEITQNAEQPFMVQTVHTTTRVLGTTFNIEAHEREGITRVTLVSGKVETGDSLHKMILLPGKMMVFENNTGRQFQQSAEGNATARIKGELVFNGVSLQEALARIGEAYNIKVILSKDMHKNYSITGHFEKESPEKILDALLAVYGFKWRKTADTYQVYQ